MFKLTVFAYYVLWQFADCYTIFDQRQEGPLNVEIDVKNVKILTLLKGSKEEYVDYDYVYDYSEMTIKPPNGTKPKPPNSTSIPTNLIPPNITTNAPILTTGQTTDVKNNTSTADAEFVSTTLYPTKLNITADNNFTTASDVESSSMPISTCKKGFKQNNNGHCELELQGTSNALRKLVKLSQKLKWRRANRHNQEEESD